MSESNEKELKVEENSSSNIEEKPIDAIESKKEEIIQKIRESEGLQSRFEIIDVIESLNDERTKFKLSNDNLRAEINYLFETIRKKEHSRPNAYYIREFEREDKLINRLFILIILAVLLYFLSTVFIPSGNYYNDSELKLNLSSIINNKGGLSSVKHEYEQVNLNTINTIAAITKENINYVSEKPKLSEILLDLKVDFYRDTSKSVIKNIGYLEEIIKEYNTTNPFDNLHEDQRYFFDNILNSSDSLYTTIEIDLTKIADELQEKNSLVNEYLSNAKSSYRNSMIAMLIATCSLLFGAFSTYRNIQNAKKIDKNLSDIRNRENDTQQSVKRQ